VEVPAPPMVGLFGLAALAILRRRKDRAGRRKTAAA
jgi:hypothetical protein